MLVLRRRPGESIVFSHPALGGDVTITITDVQGDRVKIGIDAPRSILIARDELLKNGPWTPTKPEQKGA